MDNKLVLWLMSKKITVEVLATENALPVYNYMAFDRRKVAAALIPPLRVYESESDTMAAFSRLGQPDLAEKFSAIRSLHRDKEDQLAIEEAKLSILVKTGKLGVKEMEGRMAALQKSLYPLEASPYTEEERKGYQSLIRDKIQAEKRIEGSKQKDLPRLEKPEKSKED